MENDDVTVQKFKDFIYNYLWIEIPLSYQNLMKTFESDWQLYEDSENDELELIDLITKQIRENLVYSRFKTDFPLDVIKCNLWPALKNYCNDLPISLTEDDEFPVSFMEDDESYPEEKNVVNICGIAIDERDGNKKSPHFLEDDLLKPLVLHISLYQLYIELKRRKAEIIGNTAIELQTKLPEKPVEEGTSKYTQTCQHIFKTPKARRIFEYLQTELVSEKSPLADYAFIFRRMQKDEFIHEDIKEKYFRDFLFDHFDIELNSKLKPYDYTIAEWKEKIYSNAIRSVRTW